MNYFLILFYALIIVFELIRFINDKKSYRLWFLIIPVLKICIFTPLVDCLSVNITSYLSKGLTVIFLFYYFMLARERRKNGLKPVKFEIGFVVIIILIPLLQITLHIFFYDRGLAAYKSGDYENAINYFDKAIAIDNRTYTAYYGEGEALDKLKKYDEAIQYFDKAINLKSTKDVLYNGKGLTLYHEKKYDEAISEYSKAIQLNPKAYVSYYNRGLAYNNLGKKDEAIKDFQEILVLKPDDQNASKALELLNEK